MKAQLGALRRHAGAVDRSRGEQVLGGDGHVWVALQRLVDESVEQDDRDARREERRADRRESARRELGEERETSAWFIVGSSLAFEAVILGLAAFIFARRDF